MFRNENLLQTKGATTGAPNSYADIAVVSLDQTIMKKKKQHFMNFFILVDIERRLSGIMEWRR